MASPVIPSAAPLNLDRCAINCMRSLYREIEQLNLAQLQDDALDFRCDLNVFFSRLIFCLFAEHTELFPQHLFSRAIQDYTSADSSDLRHFFVQLFLTLDTERRGKIPRPFSDFPYVNGAVFSFKKHNIIVPEFNAQARALLLQCAEFDWSKINPDIFGVIFQNIVDTKSRDENGIAFTDLAIVEKVIDPLFMDSLRAELRQSCQSSLTPDAQTHRLQQLLERISKIKIFDPACGSGNFLIVTYKRLRELEAEVIRALLALDPDGLARPIVSRIRLENFYGIELEDFPRELAVLALYIAEQQMNLTLQPEFGYVDSILPIRNQPNIVRGNAAKLDWQKVCPNPSLKIHLTSTPEIYVIGNPPYRGCRGQSPSQKADMRRVFAEQVERYKDLDYAALWLFKGANYIQHTWAKLCFVVTNSICQGDQVGMLWPALLDKVCITIAYQSLRWRSSAQDVAGGVTVNIIGLTSKESSQSCLLYDGQTARQVASVNPYLVESSDPHTIVLPLRTNLNAGFPDMPKGNMPYGKHLLLSAEETQAIITYQPQATKIIRKLINARNFINGGPQYCLWIHDADLTLAQSIPMVAERIELSRQDRLKSTDRNALRLAQRPHQFRELSEPTEMSLAVPSTTTEHRDYIPMAYLDRQTIASNALFVIYQAEFWLFALLTSRMHMAWVRTVCGKLKNDYRYSSVLGYNTFPCPQLTQSQKTDLAQAAQRILTARKNHPEMTLAELYHPATMPEDLRLAHAKNDLLVDKIYHNQPFANDEERLAMLFSLYKNKLNS